MELSERLVSSLVAALESEFYVSEEAARSAVRERGSFNLIHFDTAFKTDLFVRGDDAFDREEFARHRLELVDAAGGRRAFVESAEDIVLRKLQWFRAGGEISDRQWSDLVGLCRIRLGDLDVAYLRRWAATLGVEDLLEKLLAA